MKAKLLTHSAALPTRGSEEAAGYDLYSDEPINIPAQSSALVSTGVALGIPKGYVGLIWPRSGLAIKKGIDVGAGVIDSDYVGEVKVLLRNTSKELFSVYDRERIAQIIIVPCYTKEIEEVDELDDTERGNKGFGSTGK